eukprot:503221_1
MSFNATIIYQDCDGKQTKFSFVYFQILVSIVMAFLVTQFMISIWKKRKDILKYHDTISSFCAWRHGWENRFLLIFTLITSLNLLCLHFEEFNSRYWNTTRTSDMVLLIIFLVECICILSLPLTGIFYTRGNHPDASTHNEDYECPYGNCKITTSEFFHMLGAYMFMLGLCVTSIVWASFYLSIFSDTKFFGLAVFSMCWAVIQLALGILFAVLQLILDHNYKIKVAFQTSKIFTSVVVLDNNSDSESEHVKLKSKNTKKEETMDNDLNEFRRCNTDIAHDIAMDDNISNFKEDINTIGAEQQKYRLIATKLRYVSFVVEGLTGISVILFCTFSTIMRIVFDHSQQKYVWF